MANWQTCSHAFRPWFGPVLKCGGCGATTMACMAPGESKPIFPPVSAIDATPEDATGVESAPRGTTNG